MSHTRPTTKHITLPILLCLAILSVASCSSDSVTPVNTNTGIVKTSGEIVYSRFRDVNGAVSPVLTEGSGFDGREVDSPSMAIDGSRAGGDKFMLFYEAESSTGVSTIGLVTSTEEDFQGLAVDRTQVVGLGQSGSGYESGATDPTVLVDKRPTESTRRYKMWFEGRTGNASTIIFATSTDGVSFTDFTVCTGLNPSFGQVRVADPSVLLDGTTYKMWFEAIDSESSGVEGAGVIGYAESSDGVAWIIKDAYGNTGSTAGPVFSSGPSGRFDSYSINAPAVLIDELVSAGSPGRFKLWYEAGDMAGDVQNTIGYSTSSDGMTWSRATLPILAPSSDNKIPLPFDSGDLEHPTAALRPSLATSTSGHFLLWYTGDGEGGASPNRIGLAKGMAP